MLWKKYFIPLAIFYTVAVIVTAFVLADGNSTALIVFLFISLLWFAVHIPTKNQN
jgi:hypothetical protein